MNFAFFAFDREQNSITSGSTRTSFYRRSVCGKSSPLGEQRQIAAAGESVDGAVAEVEAGAVAALTVTEEGRAGGLGGCLVLGHDSHAGLPDQRVERGPRTRVAVTPGEDQAGLEQADGCEQVAIRFDDDPQEGVRFGFRAQNRDQRRAIDDDHAGRPFFIVEIGVGQQVVALQPGSAAQADRAQLIKAHSRLCSPGGAASDAIGDELGADLLQHGAHTGARGW